VWPQVNEFCQNRKAPTGTSNLIPQVLMIQRKDSLGFMDIMRGKYKITDADYICKQLRGMTPVERHRLLYDDFDTIWDELWGSEYEISQKYANNRVISKEKLTELRNGLEVQGEKYNLESLLRREPVLYDTPEWGFPKGRRDPYESDMTCAFRELKEETGITEDQLWKIQNVNPLVEQFYGSNNVHYRHTYYVANYIGSESIDYDKQNDEMVREIGNLAWKNLDEALLMLRPENVEKRGIIIQLANLLRNFSPVLRTRLYGVKSEPTENKELEQEKYVFTAAEGRAESGRPFRTKARTARRRL
jgi:8-oxo-dGTP pyrophosphatase MutT (NUDIX family)